MSGSRVCSQVKNIGRAIVFDQRLYLVITRDISVDPIACASDTYRIYAFVFAQLIQVMTILAVGSENEGCHDIFSLSGCTPHGCSLCEIISTLGFGCNLVLVIVCIEVSSLFLLSIIGKLTILDTQNKKVMILNFFNVALLNNLFHKPFFQFYRILLL